MPRVVCKLWKFYLLQWGGKVNVVIYLWNVIRCKFVKKSRVELPDNFCQILHLARSFYKILEEFYNIFHAGKLVCSLQIFAKFYKHLIKAQKLYILTFLQNFLCSVQIFHARYLVLHVSKLGLSCIFFHFANRSNLSNWTYVTI